jgi:hypothetical protein
MTFFFELFELAACWFLVNVAVNNDEGDTQPRSDKSPV